MWPRLSTRCLKEGKLVVVLSPGLPRTLGTERVFSTCQCLLFLRGCHITSNSAIRGPARPSSGSSSSQHLHPHLSSDSSWSLRFISDAPPSPSLWNVHAKPLQSCPTLCNPLDCGPPGSSVHGILQARILEWAAISFSRGSSGPRDRTHVSYVAYIGRRFLHH